MKAGRIIFHDLTAAVSTACEAQSAWGSEVHTSSWQHHSLFLTQSGKQEVSSNREDNILYLNSSASECSNEAALPPALLYASSLFSVFAARERIYPLMGKKLRKG